MNDAVKEQIKELIDSQNPKDTMKYIRSIVSKSAIDNMNKAIAGCNDCGLNCPTKTIAYGNTNASVMIISDSILKEQIKTNTPTIEPFYGTEELSTITDVFDYLNINKNELFYMNAVNCCASVTINNEVQYCTPTKQQIEHCCDYVKYAVDVVHPSAIMLLGNIALNIFKRSTIVKEHGKWLEAYTIPAMPIYSPSHLRALKGTIPEDERIIMVNSFVNDIRNFFLYIQNNFPDNNILTKPIQ